MTSKKKLINPLQYIKKESPIGIIIYGEDSDKRNKYMKKLYKQCEDAGACLYDESSEDVINKLSINKNNKKDSVIFFSIGEHVKMDGATCQALNEYLLFGSSLRTAVVISIETKEKLLECIGSFDNVIADAIQVG